MELPPPPPMGATSPYGYSMQVCVVYAFRGVLLCACFCLLSAHGKIALLLNYSCFAMHCACFTSFLHPAERLVRSLLNYFAKHCACFTSFLHGTERLVRSLLNYFAIYCACFLLPFCLRQKDWYALLLNCLFSNRPLLPCRHTHIRRSPTSQHRLPWRNGGPLRYPRCRR